MKDHTTIVKAGIDFEFHDWKAEAESVLKPPAAWHFKLSETKRLTLQKSSSNATVVVRGDPSYNIATALYRSVLKKKKTVADMNPEKIECGNLHNVSREKLRD